MRAAHHADSALDAQAQLEALARELDKTHPGAAVSLREGMAETLTVLRLDLPPTLAQTLRSTNAIESMIGICREHAKNVKRWRDGQMALRWCAAGMLEASKQFRRVNGHLHLPALRAALEREVAQPVGATCHDEDVNVDWGLMRLDSGILGPIKPTYISLVTVVLLALTALEAIRLIRRAPTSLGLRARGTWVWLARATES